MPRVLVVDDSRVILKLIEVQLAEVNADFTYVTSAEEALAVAEKDRPDVVISDIHLAKMDGFELSRALKAVHGKDVCAILMTADQDLTRHDAYGAGRADAFVSKPLDGVRLKRLVEMFLRDKTPGPTSRMRTIRVLIAAESSDLRASVEAGLSCDPAFVLVGSATDGPNAIELADRLRPDLLLLESSLGRADNYAVTRRAAENTRVILLAPGSAVNHDDADHEAGAIESVIPPRSADPMTGHAIRLRSRIRDVAARPHQPRLSEA